jgi:ABC-type enterochelin transport system permease subunit
MVPLIGFMLGGVVLRGSYAMLWMALAIVVAAYVPADRFTVAETGEAFSTYLGLNYRRIMAPGPVLKLICGNAQVESRISAGLEFCRM